MAAKVLLGLLVAAGVTGAAVLYSPCSVPPAAEATAEVTACSASDDLPACCVTKSRVATVCCEATADGPSHDDGGTAVAAVAGGACLGR